MSYVHWTPMAEGLLEAVWVVDAESLRILTANSAAARLQQLEPGALRDTPVTDMIASPEDQLFWQAAGDGILSELHSDTQLRRADGSTVWVERRITRVATDTETVFLVAMLDKTHQLQSQQRLEEILGELRATLESTADGILVCDLDGGIRSFNQLFAAQWELPAELLTCKDDAAVRHALAQGVHDASRYQQRLNEIERSILMEAVDVLVLRNGRVLERITRPQLARGRPIGRVYVFRDITERMATEAQLRLAAKVFESSLDAIFVTDPRQCILSCNPAAEHLAQSSADALQGRYAPDLFYSPSQTEWLQQLRSELQAQGYWEGELWMRQPDGSATALQASWVVLRDQEGSAQNTVLFVKDLTEKLAAQQRIEQLAYTDVLTGLPNRLMLTERVNHALRLAERTGNGFAVLFLDLDRFKSINDSLGHLFGDKVLIEIAQRLKTCLRQTDTLCRLGGDEFVIHLHDADTVGAEITAQRITEALERPVHIDKMDFTLSCSLGIAMYPGDGKTLDELIQHADTAMYQVKERGKGHYRFYRPQMNADLLSRIQLDQAMREGLKRHEFVLHYQPRVNLANGRIEACEALIRWNHPQQGMVPPGTFITVAEETGLIVALGEWVLQEAVRQAAQWRQAGHHCQMAVNVSALQFQQAQFVDDVDRILAQHQLPAHLLELELTESILIRDANEAMERLHALSKLGVQLALDDFGTGYSSLTYLRRFPLHKLKIDRSFIASMHNDEADAAIVAAIIQMGHALRMELVAEGVELDSQKTQLQHLGCNHFQGFLFSRAVPAAEFEQLLTQPAPPDGH